MNYLLVGLGNPGEKYEDTRHNAGRLVLEYLRVGHDFSEWDKKVQKNALVSDGELAGAFITLLAPNNFMNNSGESASAFMKKTPDAKLVLIYDDIDLPLGKMKISYDRGTGGHNGVASIIEHIGTEAFLRIRIGVAPVTTEGEIAKPKGEGKVNDFLLNDFSKNERAELDELMPTINDALGVIIKEGKEVAMNKFN